MSLPSPPTSRMASKPATQQFDSDADFQSTIDIGALLNTLWRGKWFLALVFFLFSFIGSYYAFKVAVPLYKSTAVVILDTKLSQFTDLQSVVGGLTGESEEVNSEVEILKSRRLIGKVVDQLELTKDPEFNANLRAPTLLDGLREWITSKVQSAETVSTHSENIQKKIERDNVIKAVLDGLSVTNVPQSLVFRITVETKDPLKSTLISDTIAEQYILDQITIKFEETEKVSAWLSERVAQFQQELEQAESSVSSFSSSIDLLSPDILTAQEVQLKELRDRLRNSRAVMSGMQEKMNALLSSDLSREDLAEISEDERLENLLDESDTTPLSNQRFDAIRNEIIAGLKQNIERTSLQVDTLQTSTDLLAEQLVRQNDDLIKLQQLKREAEAVRLLYEYFLGRLKETRAQQGTQQADSRVLSPAVIPSATSAPNKPLIIGSSGFFGALLAVAVLLLLEQRKKGMRTANDLERLFGYPVLGQIPKAPHWSRTALLKYLIEHPTSAVSEAYRSLRTTVALLGNNGVPQVIVSTSCVPAEGKTTNSIGLAHNLIGLGKKVLLLEGDIRRRTLDVYFPNLSKEQSILSAMNNLEKLDSYIYFDEVSGLDVLGGAKSKTSAADLFASDRFSDLLVELRERYDVIVIDCPPVLAVPDARIVAQKSDSILFTVRWDSTTDFQIAEAMRLLHSAGQTISGFILGQIDMRRIKSYGRYGQYSAYTHDSGHYYDN